GRGRAEAPPAPDRPPRPIRNRLRLDLIVRSIAKGYPIQSPRGRARRTQTLRVDLCGGIPAVLPKHDCATRTILDRRRRALVARRSAYGGGGIPHRRPPARESLRPDALVCP